MIDLDNISLVDVSLLDRPQRLAAAKLVMESLPAYYRVEGIVAEMAAVVATMLGEPRSEVGEGFAALVDGAVVGILTHLEAGALPFARLRGAQALMKRLPKDAGAQFREHLKHYDAGFGALPGESRYLCRFAVDQLQRGSGLAGWMLTAWFSIESGEGEAQTEFSLHVNKDNARAIGFYRKHGFVVTDDGKRYLTMVRGGRGE